MAKISIGDKFGMLTVVEQGEDYISPNGSKDKRWYCLCDCGNPNKKLVRDTNLKHNHVKSCGCLKGKFLKEYYKNKNEYIFNKDYCECVLSNNKHAKIDIEDYDLLKNFGWYDNGIGYVRTGVTLNGNFKRFYMHDFIMGCINEKYDFVNDKYVVDHINHDTYDNRKKNLRVITQSQNIMNSKLQKNNKSGISGVYFDDDYKKWMARITKNREVILLGSFENYNDAVEARRSAEEKYFGEYSYDNSMKISKDM